MRIRILWTITVLAASFLPGTLYAQSNAYSALDRTQSYSRVSTGISIPATNLPGLGSASLSLQTSVSVPDGGEAFLGGYSRYSDGRTTFGTPLLSHSPYGSRLFGNSAYGRELRATRASIRVRVIRLEEEEKRQTGVGR